MDDSDTILWALLYDSLMPEQKIIVDLLLLEWEEHSK